MITPPPPPHSRWQSIALAFCLALVLAGESPAATFLVTNTADSGAGSLRQAILDANSMAGADTINFAIPGAGVHTISPATVLPTISQATTINGYSQPGSSVNTLAVGNNAMLQIVLNGASAGAVSGLTINAGSSTVQGLVINGFTGNGIVLQTGSGNTIAGNFIGTNDTGTAAVSNTGGILLSNSPSNIIGGTDPAARNVILGGANNAIFTNSVDTGGGNTIQGNYIGSNAAGTAVLGNTGISLTNPNNLIGGTAEGARNVISTQGRNGITLAESNADNNIVQGNYIGVTAAGTAVLGNNAGIEILRAEGNLIGGTTSAARNVIVSVNDGVRIFGNGGLAQNNTVQGNYIGTNAAGTADPTIGTGATGVRLDSAVNNTIGGTAPGTGNVIAGFAIGVDLSAGSAPVSSGNLVQGNFIGTNAAGTAALGNAIGVQIGGNPGVNNNTIGGTASGAGNVISGNTGSGVFIFVPAGTVVGNTIQGNLIGLAANGATALGNGLHGVYIGRGNNNSIGGIAAGSANTIAFNGGDGVFVESGTGNAILANSIYSNTGLGIDHLSNGVTPNDAGDPDAGANGLQNFPTLTVATSNTLSTHIEGILDSLVLNSTYPIRLEFFENLVADPTGFGEGRFFLGALAVGGPGAFMADFALPSTRVTATATGANGNTSEFSAAFNVTQLPAPMITPEPGNLAIWGIAALAAAWATAKRAHNKR